MKRLIDKKDYKALAESALTAFALGGTAAIPLYGAVQYGLSKIGINLPGLSPTEEMTGADLGQSASPLVSMPTDIGGVAGPLFGPPLELYSALARGGEEKAVAKAGRGIMGAGPSGFTMAIDELLRGGVTSTPSGRPILKRPTHRVLLSGIRMAPTARGEISAAREEIMRAVRSGQNLPEAIEAARKRGVLNVRQIVGQLRGRKSMEEKRSTVEEFLGR